MRRRKSALSLATADRPGPSRPVVFSVGVGVGALGGVVVGTLVGKQVLQLAGMLVSVVDRRLSGTEDERLRFELLLQ